MYWVLWYVIFSTSVQMMVIPQPLIIPACVCVAVRRQKIKDIFIFVSISYTTPFVMVLLIYMT